MNDILKSFLISFLPSLIIAIITAKLTVDLSIKRFRSEKWWEKKHETYENVVSCLSKLLYYCRENRNLLDDSINIEAGARIFERLPELSSKYHSALEEFNQIVNASIFNISEKAASELNKLREEIDGGFDSIKSFEDASYIHDLIESSIRDIKTYSKEDLGIGG